MITVLNSDIPAPVIIRFIASIMKEYNCKVAQEIFVVFVHNYDKNGRYCKETTSSVTRRISHVLYINIKKSHYEMLRTLCHELRHAWQHENKTEEYFRHDIPWAERPHEIDAVEFAESVDVDKYYTKSFLGVIKSLIRKEQRRS